MKATAAFDSLCRTARTTTRQRPSSRELERQAAPNLKDLAEIGDKYGGEMPSSAFLYAAIEYRALTIAISSDDDMERIEWLNDLMDECLEEFGERKEPGIRGRLRAFRFPIGRVAAILLLTNE